VFITLEERVRPRAETKGERKADVRCEYSACSIGFLKARNPGIDRPGGVLKMARTSETRLT
jgi:hypothetical protein